MTTDEWDAQQLVCVFCLVKTDRRTGEKYRNCDLCVGRSSDRYCECGHCPWLAIKGDP